MENDFIFIDKTDNNKKKVFHRKLFYKYIRELIIKFFNVKLENNEINQRFIGYLNNLKEAGDVYFLMHEMPYHWALSIIQNTIEVDESIMYSQERKEEELDFCRKFLKEHNIKYFLEETK